MTPNSHICRWLAGVATLRDGAGPKDGVPLALGGGEPGNELQTPMAIVILGGLISATALNMVVLPALYWLFGDRSPAATGADDPLAEPVPTRPLIPSPA